MVEGTVIGPYRIVAKIGEGGMGAVYVAEHTLIQRKAAIKIVRPVLASRKDLVERFLTEARATAAVNDPGIVQVYDFGVHSDGSVYLAMELLDGETLAKRLVTGGALELVEALRITRQVAGALAATHKRGIVHRDLKPENLFLVRDRDVAGGIRTKILDFGIAKLVESDRNQLTLPGAVIGTPAYMSPEQCSGEGNVDHRTDVYALGCVLFHMLVGTPPFNHSEAVTLLLAHLNEPPPHLPSRFPDEVDRVVRACLAKDPAQRTGSMAELQQVCTAIMSRISRRSLEEIEEPPYAPQLGSPPAPTLSMIAATAGVPNVAPTTLATAVGQSQLPPTRRPAWPIAIMFALGAAGGVAVAIVASDDDTSANDRSLGPAEVTTPIRHPPPSAAVDASTGELDGGAVSAIPDASLPPLDANVEQSTSDAGHIKRSKRRNTHAGSDNGLYDDR